MGYKLTNPFVKNPLNSQMANMEQFVQICQDKLGFKIKFKLDRINIRYFGIIRVENISEEKYEYEIRDYNS